MKPRRRVKTPALRACLKNRLGQGKDRDEAEDLCRHVDAATSPAEPPMSFMPSAQANEDMSASVGPGWRSGGANLGSGRVMKPDPVSTVNDWVRAQKRPLSRKDWPAWQEHARRMGLGPEDMDTGWRTVMDRPEQVQLAALATLKKVFGESVSWSGYWVPQPGLLGGQKRVTSSRPELERDPANMQVRETKKKKKKLGERISVNVKTHQAPFGNEPESTPTANPGFGFRTWSASLVFEMAQRLVGLYPQSKPEEILAMAIRKSGVTSTELTPEDDKMLKMAIDWAQNGAAKTNVRIGGTPGGPLRSTGDGHFGNPRGTFGLP
jgi:hypothetical protein